MLPAIKPREGWETCIVAATGPSLTPEIAARTRGHKIVAVNDAYRLLPFADLLYACDAAWWDIHQDCDGFLGEKWSSHDDLADRQNLKLVTAERHGLQLVQGYPGDGFSLNASRIHYGSNSGFQAINLAILFGARRLYLIGFDMTARSGRAHFFGNHPRGLRQNSNYERFIPDFNRAARLLPPEIQIFNCTPGSALRCFPFAELPDA